MKTLKDNIVSTAVVGLLAGALGAALVVGSTIPGSLRLPAWWPVRPAQNGLPVTSNNVNTVTGGEETQVIEVVKKDARAVVSVIISKDVPVYQQYYAPSSPFDQFFGNGFPGLFNTPTLPQLRQNGTQKQEIGGGSGFLISADGYIITNKHVVDQQGAEYTVFTNSGAKYPAKVIARDPVNDIAVIKIEAANMPFLTFADSDRLQVGQTAIAIGNALGEFRNTVSVGVVSGLSRSIIAGDGTGQTEQLDQVIQTDAAINPGNSGGPLLNLSGQVIGVNVAVAQGGQSVGFALPSNLVSSVAETVQKTGKIVRPYLGVRYVTITPELKDTNKLAVDYGALVTRGDTQDQLPVISGSPADKAGLAEGDIILEVDGQKLDQEKSLASAVRNKKVGDNIALKVLSKGREKTITIRLEEMPQ